MARPDPSDETLSSRTSRTRTPTAVQGIPQLLRSIEVRVELLQARGMPVPRLHLAGPYARFLASESLMLDPAGEDETGFDAVDSDRVRYRIMGTKRDDDRELIVPGLPDRAFDRIIAIYFGDGYGIISAGMAGTEAFLRHADYRSERNEWVLSATDDFWRSGEVIDLTVTLRAQAARAATEESLPALESFLGPMPYPSRAPDADLAPPRA